MPATVSMKTMGLPPAAPGIAPMPDIFLISELARFGCVARSYSARERRAPLPHLFMHDNIDNDIRRPEGQTHTVTERRYIMGTRGVNEGSHQIRACSRRSR